MYESASYFASLRSIYGDRYESTSTSAKSGGSSAVFWDSRVPEDPTRSQGGSGHMTPEVGVVAAEEDPS